MVKRKSSEKKGSNNSCGHHHGMKLSTVAFVLFLITVWPGFMNLVQSIHWGWFLAATILLSAGHWKHCRDWCKK